MCPETFLKSSIHIRKACSLSRENKSDNTNKNFSDHVTNYITIIKKCRWTDKQLQQTPFCYSVVHIVTS